MARGRPFDERPRPRARRRRGGTHARVPESGPCGDAELSTEIVRWVGEKLTEKEREELLAAERPGGPRYFHGIRVGDKSGFKCDYGSHAFPGFAAL